MSRYQFAAVRQDGVVTRLLGEYEAGSREADEVVRANTSLGTLVVCLDCDARVGDTVLVDADGVATEVVS